MFSGIVEATAATKNVQKRGDILQLTVQRPTDFNDLKGGDSISVNGICLTVETFDSDTIQFALAAETLQITKWNEHSLIERQWNLERSLRLGDRIHGHMVSGHVDAMGEVKSVEDLQETRFLRVRVPEDLQPYLWKKGSITIQGVSLTVNKIEDFVLEVCLIPETLNRTNLGALKAGDLVTLEVDTMARAILQYLKSQGVPDEWKGKAE